MRLYTLEELYDRAVDKACFSQELKSKDEAMAQAAEEMRSEEQIGDDVDLDEDTILDYAKKREMLYDNSGNLICMAIID